MRHMVDTLLLGDSLSWPGQAESLHQIVRGAEPRLTFEGGLGRHQATINGTVTVTAEGRVRERTSGRSPPGDPQDRRSDRVLPGVYPRAVWGKRTFRAAAPGRRALRGDPPEERSSNRSRSGVAVLPTLRASPDINRSRTRRNSASRHLAGVSCRWKFRACRPRRSTFTSLAERRAAGRTPPRRVRAADRHSDRGVMKRYSVVDRHGDVSTRGQSSSFYQVSHWNQGPGSCDSLSGPWRFSPSRPLLMRSRRPLARGDFHGLRLESANADTGSRG